MRRERSLVHEHRLSHRAARTDSLDVARREVLFHVVDERLHRCRVIEDRVPVHGAEHLHERAVFLREGESRLGGVRNGESGIADGLELGAEMRPRDIALRLQLGEHQPACLARECTPTRKLCDDPLPIHVEELHSACASAIWYSYPCSQRKSWRLRAKSCSTVSAVTIL